MSILDNEGHDPTGLGNVLRRTDAQDLAEVARLREDNQRLRAALIDVKGVLKGFNKARVTDKPLYHFGGSLLVIDAALGNVDEQYIAGETK